MSRTFENAKIGDKVWDFLHKKGMIAKIENEKIFVEFYNILGHKVVYDLEGKILGTSYPQTLFWGEIEYKIPEKPLNLEDELKKLEVVKFRTDEENYYLYWDNCCELIGYDYACLDELIGCKYFSISSINTFIENITGKKITKEQFFKAYENVFGGRND